MDFSWPSDMKRTKQREDVFRVLVESEEPLSANEIYQKVIENTKDSSYAISTVYRSLNLFEERGFVEKTMLMGNDIAYYAWKQDEHKHYAICLACRKKIPLKECPMEESHLHADIDGFHVTGHKIELYGYCDSCEIKGNAVEKS